MSVITDATILSADSGGRIILPDDTDYDGGLSITVTSSEETLYLPLGNVNGTAPDLWSIGSKIDLSNVLAFRTGSSIDLVQTPLSSGVTGTYTPIFSNKALLDNIVGNEGADSISGNALANKIYGGHAWDVLLGMAGNDTIYGGTGYSDATDMADEICGGSGADLIYGNAGNDYINGGKEGDDIIGGTGVANASDLADTAEDGNDFIYGGMGNDYIRGNAGDDTIYGGGAAVDPVEGNDTIYGNAGNDKLYGNGGNDNLYGGGGNDYLHGGMGDDVYHFAAGEGSDTIAHFQGAGVAGGDVLSLASNINGSGITSLVTLLSHAVSDANGMWIDLGGGNSLILAGVSTLGADDVLFV